jgi:hypothetical protein
MLISDKYVPYLGRLRPTAYVLRNREQRLPHVLRPVAELVGELGPGAGERVDSRSGTRLERVSERHEHGQGFASAEAFDMLVLRLALELDTDGTRRHSVGELAEPENRLR